jgi:hypothetical protein
MMSDTQPLWAFFESVQLRGTVWFFLDLIDFLDQH